MELVEDETDLNVAVDGSTITFSRTSDADQIIVLKEGRVHAAGSLSDLLSSNEEMQRLWSGEGVD